ncbi:transcriptional regulator (plasmid) [Arthrobacter sp. ZXY-2]|nr:transcriptional regulator [Arthrobacter sp. ZXY-2]
MVARWERGDHEITMANLARIADALGIVFTVRFGTNGSQK